MQALTVLPSICRDSMTMVEIRTDQGSQASVCTCMQQCVDKVELYSRTITFEDITTSFVAPDVLMGDSTVPRKASLGAADVSSTNQAKSCER